jgi:hypothetical protein
MLEEEDGMENNIAIVAPKIQPIPTVDHQAASLRAACETLVHTEDQVEFWRSVALIRQIVDHDV